MFDFIADALGLLISAPCSITLLLLGSFVGWSLGGHAGVLVGSVCGLALGAWLDISSSRIATTSRWPVAVGALVILAVAIFR
jgi:hypothetical protein